MRVLLDLAENPDAPFHARAAAAVEVLKVSQEILHAHDQASPNVPEEAQAGEDQTSFRHGHRLQYDLVVEGLKALDTPTKPMRFNALSTLRILKHKMNETDLDALTTIRQ